MPVCSTCVLYDACVLRVCTSPRCMCTSPRYMRAELVILSMCVRAGAGAWRHLSFLREGKRQERDRIFKWGSAPERGADARPWVTGGRWQRVCSGCSWPGMGSAAVGCSQKTFSYARQHSPGNQRTLSQARAVALTDRRRITYSHQGELEEVVKYIAILKPTNDPVCQQSALNPTLCSLHRTPSFPGRTWWVWN